MPVWHAKTKALVASGELAVVGIVHEQHPARGALFAQWKEFDFPLLWDPFGVTGLKVVPVVTAIDAHGVVRLPKPDPRKFDEQFMPLFMEKATFAEGEDATDAPTGFVVSELVGREGGQAVSLARVVQAGVSILPSDSWGKTSTDLEAIMGWSGSPFADFCAGVAHRLRYDSQDAGPDDFQSALSHWTAALHAQPNQYIWRRRIQQWGPRLDKPYPFYDWVESATREVAARGGTPVPLRAKLSGSEVAGKTTKIPGARKDAAVAGSLPKKMDDPDPLGKVVRDGGELVGLELAVAQNTASAGGSVRSPMGSSRVHVTLRPKEGTKWPVDADPPLVWLKLPEQWDASSSAFEFPAPKPGREEVPLTADFEISTETNALGPPDENAKMPPSELEAYAVYSICLADGTCVFRRQDFVIQVTFPPMPDLGPPPEEDTKGGGK